jgi:hypothetical protein
MRVLVVEDEPYMAEAIRDRPRLEAIAADVAGDGDTPLLLPLSTNLVQNAIVRNQGTALVTTSARPTSVVLGVESTHEQLTPRWVATLAGPFLRGRHGAPPARAHRPGGAPSVSVGGRNPLHVTTRRR